MYLRSIRDIGVGVVSYTAALVWGHASHGVASRIIVPVILLAEKLDQDSDQYFSDQEI